MHGRVIIHLFGSNEKLAKLLERCKDLNLWVGICRLRRGREKDVNGLLLILRDGSGRLLTFVDDSRL